MFARTALRAASRSTFKGSNRAFSVTACARSGHGPPQPQIFGPGGKDGEIPSAFEQVTGLERLQLLGDIEGVDVFDMAPLDASRVGTKANPVMVPSMSVERIVGCTGVPADSHQVLWFPLTHDAQHRCVECGSVYAMDYQGAADPHATHHH